MSRYSGGGGGGSERWDPERFSRERYERSRGPPVVERERFFEERDRYGGGESRVRESSVDEVYYGRGGRGAPVRYKEEDRYFKEEKFSRPMPSRPRGGPGRYYDEEGDDLEGSPNRGQIIPFVEARRKSITEKFASPARRVAPRPTFIQRQSSLDTFDRKPMPRYGDRARFEPPEVIPVPLPRRRRSPPRYMERDYEEIRVAEPEYYGDEEFRGYTEREVSTVRRRRAPSEVREREVFEEREEIREEIVEEEKPEYPKRGKTKMPMRLINKRAIIELGYPFEEEGETLIILKALGKDNIDEVIEISRRYNAGGASQENRTTYTIEAPPPPPEEKIIERRTEIIREVPEIPRSVRDWDMMSNAKSGREPSPSARSRKSRAPSPSAKSHKSRARSVSSASTTRQIEIVRGDDKEESATIAGGAFALMAPERRRDERSIKAEIRALEAEKKALKLEREMERERSKADRYRESEVEIIKERDVVKIEKDKKAPDPRIIRAMLATLT